jgi:hypothetical protein
LSPRIVGRLPVPSSSSLSSPPIGIYEWILGFALPSFGPDPRPATRDPAMQAIRGAYRSVPERELIKHVRKLVARLSRAEPLAPKLSHARSRTHPAQPVSHPRSRLGSRA